jgi:hypothetical protein
MAEDHVEAVDGATVGQVLLVASVDLSLGAGGDLEAAVHLGAAAQAKLGGDLRGAGAHVLLDAPVGAPVAVIASQTLVDGGRTDLRLRGAQLRVDLIEVRVDQHHRSHRPN